MPSGMQDLSSPTRNGTCSPAIEVQSLNQWTPRKSLAFVCLLSLLLLLCFVLFVLPQKSRKRERDPGIPQDFWKEGRKNHPSKGFHCFLAFPPKIAS